MTSAHQNKEEWRVHEGIPVRLLIAGQNYVAAQNTIIIPRDKWETLPLIKTSEHAEIKA